MFLQKLTFFPGKKLTNAEKKRTDEEMSAELFVRCLNELGENWIVNFSQPQPEADITDVIISNQFEQKRIQIVTVDKKLMESRPQLREGKALTRWVEDHGYMYKQAELAIKQKVKKYGNSASGYVLLLTGGIFDHLKTTKTVCDLLKKNFEKEETFFDQIWYLFSSHTTHDGDRIFRIK